MTIEKRGRSYRVTVYKNGIRHRKTFKTKVEALQWELAMQTASTVEDVESRGKTFGDLLVLYYTDVGRHKKSAVSINSTINVTLKHPIASTLLENLKTEHIEKFFKDRQNSLTKRGTPPSLITLQHFRTVFSVSIGYGLKLKWMKDNPIQRFKLETPTGHRERTATDEEIKILCDFVGWDGISPPRTYRQQIIAAFVFSTLTGMRQGEIIQLQPDWIQGRFIKLPEGTTKTSRSRNVALSKKALALLNTVLSLNFNDNVFGLRRLRSRVSVVFHAIREAAGLGPVYDEQGNIIKEGLNFHDGRATFATWAASARSNGAPHLDPMTLARQLGHSDVKMTMRYYRSTPEQIADMLDMED